MKLNLVALIFIASSVAGLSHADENPVPEKAELVKTVKNAEGENLVADFTGRTLYVFDLDQGKAAPACSAECAEIWPPYLLNEEELPDLKAPLGTIMRTNKQLQLTYEGRPVYTYAFDRSAADDRGDGIGGVWHYIELEK